MHRKSDLPPAQSRATDFFQELRAEILSGRRLPGERVLLHDLQDAFKVSLSPIREGLARLVAEGLLVPSGLKGYRVAQVSVEELLDVKRTRIRVESMALRESLLQGGEEWEIALSASFQRLRNFENRRWGAGEVEQWEERHHAFHSQLIAACGSPLLIRFCRSLHETSDRYRRIYLSVHDPARADRSRVMSEHQRLYEAALARDAERACQVLGQHIEATSARLLKVMSAPDSPLGSPP